jgi:hypothetical protein
MILLLILAGSKRLKNTGFPALYPDYPENFTMV